MPGPLKRGIDTLFLTRLDPSSTDCLLNCIKQMFIEIKNTDMANVKKAIRITTNEGFNYMCPI